MLTKTQISVLKSKAQRYGHTSVKDFKAKGDSKAVDLGYLHEAVDFIQNHTEGQGELYFPNGVYRINNTFKIGGQSVTAADALLYQANRTQGEGKAPSFDINEHLTSGRTLPISLKFSPRAFIFGDFHTDELTPIISYGCYAYQYAGVATQSTFITGLKVFGRNGLDQNARGDGGNQVGLLMTGGDDITLSNCRFYGLQDGLIHNICYNNLLQNIKFNNCERGMMTLGSHSSTGILLKADHCRIGFEINSGATSWQQINSEQSNRALQIGASNVVVNGGYMEQLDRIDNETEYQLTIGYSNSHPFGQQQLLRDVEVNGLVISSHNQRHILIEDQVERCKVNTTMEYGYNVYNNPNTKITSENIVWELNSKE